MGVLLRIALRNLLEHKSKTLIIGIIVAVGVLVMILGNAFLDRASAGVKKNFTENFTGDAYIYGKAPTPTSILFGALTATTSNAKTPLLPDYPGLVEYLEKRSDVEAVAGQVSGMALFNLESTGEVGSEAGAAAGDDGNQSAMGGAVIVGMDPLQYRKLFDNFEMSSGHYLEPGDSGVMISQDLADRIAKWSGKTLKAGDSIILQGISSGGFSMRKAPIVGLFKFKNDSEANDFLAYADVDTVRMLSGLTLGGDKEVVLTERTKALLAVENEDDIFGAEETIQGASSLNAVSEAAQAAVSDTPRAKAVADSGAWQFILVKLKNPLMTAAFVRDVNMHFLKEGIKAQAGDWKGAASPFSQSIDVVRYVLTVVILILAIVAVVIIMNTLVVSVIERTGEIGTMRALGAQKGFIWRMFLTETLCVTGVFGLAGTALAGIAALIVNAFRIPAGNAFLKVLFGGPALTLGVGPGAVASTLVVVLLVSAVAHIYPVVVALRVQPVRAMQVE